MRSRSVPVWLLAIFQIWLAHLLVYLMHEYVHSFMAWLFHYKANPLALDYGGLNLGNLLFQDDIDENVDYAPIFSAGHSYIAAWIAVAGVFIGNGISYIVSRLLFARANRKRQRAWAMFFFWTCAMSVGNFLSYVPVRTFTTHADMATAAKGFNASPWLICILLGVPFALSIGHFFVKLLPSAEEFLFPNEPAMQAVLVLLSTYLVFVFFGGSGFHNYGATSYSLSAISEYVFFPFITIVCWQQMSVSRHGRSGG